MCLTTIPCNFMEIALYSFADLSSMLYLIKTELALNMGVNVFP